MLPMYLRRRMQFGVPTTPSRRTPNRSRFPTVAHAAAHVFASNYGLHMGMLTVCVVAHLSVVLTVPEAAVNHTLALIATLPLIAGRVALHHHVNPTDAQRWASTGWCLTIILVYVSTSLDPAAACAPAERAVADPLFGLVIFALCAVVGVMHASVAPPWSHSVAVLSALVASLGLVIVQTGSRAMVGWGANLLVSHVCGYVLSTHCFEQQATIVRFKVDNAEFELRNAQLVGEKEKLAWEVASHHNGDDPRDALGATVPVGYPLAQHRTLGVLQDQHDGEEDPRERLGATVPEHLPDCTHVCDERCRVKHRTLGAMQDQATTDEAVSCAQSFDHVDSSASSPTVPKRTLIAPTPPKTPSSGASLQSSVMDTISQAAKKSPTRAPPPPKKESRLPRPTTVRSEPSSSTKPKAGNKKPPKRAVSGVEKDPREYS